MENNNISSEQQLRIAKYQAGLREEKYTALQTIRNRYLRLHNRLPSKEEETSYIKTTIGGGSELNRLEEPPLEESHPEDYFPGVATAKAAGTGLVGGAALLSMMLRKGAVQAKGIAKRQGGWIGSRRSPGKDKELWKQAKGMFKEGVPDNEVYQNTGWFQLIKDEPRFVDLDFVDDLAKYKGEVGKYVKNSSGKLVIDSPSLKKHVKSSPTFRELTDKQVLTKPKGWQGSHNRATGEVNLAPGRMTKDVRRTKEHEIAHYIQARQGNPGGTNLKTVQQDLLPLDTAKNIYRYSYGEVEARLTQYYHKRANVLLRAGMTTDEVKKVLSKVHPITILKQHEKNFDPKKIWTSIREVVPEEYITKGKK